MISDRLHSLLMAIMAFACAGVSLTLLSEVLWSLCADIRKHLAGLLRRW